MAEVYILWWRQMKRFFRTKSRIFGTIGQPILFLLALGYGLGAVFERAGQGDYLQFLVPGIILQTVLFSGVYWGIQILFDKRFGFLKEMLVAPVPRTKILLGNALGGTTISIVQAFILFVVAVAFGFRPENWAMMPAVFIIIVVLSLTLTSFGAGLASMVEDFQGFQAINNFLIFPLFFLSSALYPLTNVPKVLEVVASINPLSYGVDALRHSMLGQGHFSLTSDLIVLAVALIVCTGFAINRFNRIQI